MIIIHYCVSNRQRDKVREKADQIKIRTEDESMIFEYAVKFPDKTLIYEAPPQFFPDNINLYTELENFVLQVEDLYFISQYNDLKIKWYWKYPVTSFFELDSLINLKPAYIVVGAPMSFDLEAVKAKTDIPLRLYANGGVERYLPRSNGFYNTFIRPEDIKVYEPYIDTLEFLTNELEKESTMLNIYQSGQWPGNLNILLPIVQFNVDNRALPDDFGETRIKCGQRCMRSSNCHFCETAFKFAEAIRNEHFRRLKEETSESE